MSTPRCISYLRVSTVEQGKSGLGLEAQRATVARYLSDHACRVLQEFVEVESGKKNGRPVLAQALAAAKKARATLIVAKLDRLGRRAAFTLGLIENSGVKVVFAEMPQASDLEIGIRAILAQEEGRLISLRTKQALDQERIRRKEQGLPKLGNPTNLDVARANSLASRRAKAAAFRENVLPIIRELQSEGLGLAGIAATLNRRGILTPRGKEWFANSVRQVLARA